MNKVEILEKYISYFSNASDDNHPAFICDRMCWLFYNRCLEELGYEKPVSLNNQTQYERWFKFKLNEDGELDRDAYDEMADEYSFTFGNMPTLGIELDSCLKHIQVAEFDFQRGDQLLDGLPFDLGKCSKLKNDLFGGTYNFDEYDAEPCDLYMSCRVEAFPEYSKLKKNPKLIKRIETLDCGYRYPNEGYECFEEEEIISTAVKWRDAMYHLSFWGAYGEELDVATEDRRMSYPLELLLIDAMMEEVLGDE